MLNPDLPRPAGVRTAPSPRQATVRSSVVAALAAACVVAVSWARSASDPELQQLLGVALWWFVAAGLVLGIEVRAVPRLLRVAALSFAGFCSFTLLSMVWAADNGAAFASFQTVSLYLAVVVAAALFVPARNALVAGAAGGLSIVAILAVGSRLFPDVFPHEPVIPALHGTDITTRLSYPIGYWNGLALTVDLALPLLLAFAASARSSLAAAAAAAPVPVVAATVYLTSSRSGTIAAGASIVVLLALSSMRLRVLAVTVATGAGSAVAVATLVAHPRFVNGDAVPGPGEGCSVAIVLLAAALGSGMLAALLRRAAPERLVVPGSARVLLLATGTAAVVGALVLVHPVRVVQDFRRPAVVATTARSAFNAHLLSMSGNGRWQLWSAAVREFRSSPIVGRGAGSYAAWWLQHGSLASFARNAHSLFLETLAELGLVGLALLLAFFALLFAQAGRILRHCELRRRPLVAASIAAGAAYVLGATVDWTWQLPGTSAIGLFLLTMSGLHRPVEASTPPARAARLAAVPVAVLLAVASAGAYLASSQLDSSARNAREGALAAAWNDAHAASRLEPFASAPYLQLALVDEQRNRLGEALQEIESAIAKGKDDWTLWLVRTRLETKAGDIKSAIASFRRAATLNPRSSLFQGVVPR